MWGLRTLPLSVCAVVLLFYPPKEEVVPFPPSSALSSHTSPTTPHHTTVISSAGILSPRPEPVLSYLNTPFSCVLSLPMVPAAAEGYGASLWRAEAGPGELERGSWTLGRAKLEKEEPPLGLCGYTAGPKAS